MAQAHAALGCQVTLVQRRTIAPQDDPELVAGLRTALAADGIGVLLSTHDPDHAFLCADRVAMLHNGGLLACGVPDDVMTTAQLQQLYGVDVVVIEVALGQGTRRVCLPLGIHL